MVLRVESILIVLIVTILLGSTGVKFQQERALEASEKKELAFQSMRLTQVDTHEVKHYLFAKEGSYAGTTLTLKDMNYTTPQSISLYAKRATYREKMLGLEGNVTLIQKGDFTYVTQKALYNLQKQTVEILSPFRATFDRNLFEGEHAIYLVEEKVLDAKAIHAVVYTVE